MLPEANAFWAWLSTLDALDELLNETKLVKLIEPYTKFTKVTLSGDTPRDAAKLIKN